MNTTPTPQTLAQRRLEILQWEKDNRNSTNVNGTEGGSCMYAPLSGKPYGCGVGRLLPESLCQKLDNMHEGYGASPTISDEKVQLLLPPEIRELGMGFLQDLQALHDTPAYFDEKGLTPYGQEIFDEFVKKHCLSIDLNILE